MIRNKFYDIDNQYIKMQLALFYQSIISFKYLEMARLLAVAVLCVLCASVARGYLDESVSQIVNEVKIYYK